MTYQKKDCMFQCVINKKVVSTGLITRNEAEDFFNKYIEDVKNNFDSVSSPSICIWINCESITDYHTSIKDIDYRDCILENGNFYKLVNLK
jgi:hypothetical protein